ncbi:MAG: NAD(P)-dependent oxidoreductase [Bradyrhizobiaceae bacterium]|nr:NAD(P)-dependent oxidoreductase [Bradyrhizobiaceae bacterium]
MTAAIRVGVIGLGAMGLQMARHIANKGFAVVGTDVNKDAMRRAEEHGVRSCPSAAEVGANADVVIVMVATDYQVNDVLKVSGLLDRLPAASVICIASSVSPETCRELATLAAARNIGVIDTPVVLGQEAANNGTLTIYAGGEERWVTRALPVLEAFGRRVIHVGALGNGQIAKTMNNLLLWACMCANFEVLTLAKSLGSDVPKLVEALSHGSGANWSLSRWGSSTGKWAEKDMDVALDIAQDAKVPMPLAGLVDQLVKSINQDKMKALIS